MSNIKAYLKEQEKKAKRKQLPPAPILQRRPTRAYSVGELQSWLIQAKEVSHRALMFFGFDVCTVTPGMDIMEICSAIRRIHPKITKFGPISYCWLCDSYTKEIMTSSVCSTCEHTRDHYERKRYHGRDPYRSQ